MAFHVGQRVVCMVGADRRWTAVVKGASYPRQGEEVTIRAINHWPGSTKLRFEEHHNEGLIGLGEIEPGFDSKWFEPVASPAVGEVA